MQKFIGQKVYAMYFGMQSGKVYDSTMTSNKTLQSSTIASAHPSDPGTERAADFDRLQGEIDKLQQERDELYERLQAALLPTFKGHADSPKKADKAGAPAASWWAYGPADGPVRQS